MKDRMMDCCRQLKRVLITLGRGHLSPQRDVSSPSMMMSLVVTRPRYPWRSEYSLSGGRWLVRPLVKRLRGLSSPKMFRRRVSVPEIVS